MKNPFQSLASSFGGTSGPAAQDIARNMPVSSSKHNNGLVMATLRALNSLGLTRFPQFRMPRVFQTAAKPDAPRPGKHTGF